MIDLTIDILRSLTHRPSLLVVLTPEKMSLAHYLLRRCEDFQLRIVAQKASEFVGALDSALPHLAEANIVLPPDQAIEDDGAIESAFRILEGGAPSVVIAHLRGDRRTLHDEGALMTRNGVLRGMAEKPGTNCLRYDSAWCGIGFRESFAAATVDSLVRLSAVGRLSGPDWRQSPLRHSPVVFVRDYIDLGVWDRLVSYQKTRL
jgi:hypothetical protein